MKHTINNFNIISSILKFDTVNCCYVVQLILRKKDGFHDSKSGEYLIRSAKQFDAVRDTIISKCNASGTRAYININRRDIRKANLELVSRIMNDEIEGICIPASAIYSSVLGKTNNGPDRMRIVDVDDVPFGSDQMNSILHIIRDSDHADADPIVAIIPSKSGFHIISNGFNPNKLKSACPKIKIMDDAITNLYIP